MRSQTVLLALFVAFAAKVKGQSDTYFVLPPLYEWQAGDHDIYLYISTSAPNASVWIYNSDTSYSQTVNVTSNSVGTVSLTTPVTGLLSTYGARESRIELVQFKTLQRRFIYRILCSRNRYPTNR